MLDDAVEFIRREIRLHLGVADGEVISGPADALLEDKGRSGVYLSLLSVEQPAALRRSRPPVGVTLGGAPRLDPLESLNIYLMFVFDFADYSASLLHLGGTIALFQEKPHFDSGTQNPANPFPAGLDRMVMEMRNTTLEEINHLGGIVGGSCLPAVIYRVGLTKASSG